MSIDTSQLPMAHELARRIIDVELLALDLRMCTRCVEALLREIVGSDIHVAAESPVYEGVPENLRRFFTSKSGQRPAGLNACCAPTEQEGCCEPDEKTACCDTTEPGACGCR